MRREYAGRYYEAVAQAKLEVQVCLTVIGTNPRCWILSATMEDSCDSSSVPGAVTSPWSPILALSAGIESLSLSVAGRRC